MTLSQGQVINDRYRIAQTIKQSNQGAIYRAWDLQNQGPCVLKEHLDAGLDEKDLFRSEAERFFKLSHPNLASVFDYFSIPDRGEYLAMEWIEGDSLQTIQDKSRQSGISRLSEAQIIPWINQICDALGYLHEQNPFILHGNIKPTNIQITPDGRAVLVDLGFSHLSMPQGRSATARQVDSGFSAPEQYGASPLDIRSDIYSLGATLYVLLTGATPPDSVDLMTGATSLIPARQLNPLITPETERTIEQAMQLNRNARLPDTRAFRNGLASAIARLSAPQPIQGATVATVAGLGVAQAVKPPSSSGAPPVATPPPINPDIPEPAPRNWLPIVIGAIAGVIVICLLLVGSWYLLFGRGDGAAVDPIATEAAQTLEAQITQNTSLTATTDAFQTEIALLTGTPGILPVTPTITETPIPPTPTRPACNKASFVSDVTIPDNTVMNPRTAFTKVWRVRNDSACTWDSNYSLVFSGGTQMSSQTAAPFPGQTPPGQTVDLSVDMVAPATVGAYQGNWLIRSPDNVTFGVGGGSNPLYVRILVTSPVQPNPGFSYDFTANYCNAQWRTTAGVISCNNISSDPRGSALPVQQAPLERGQENEPGLWVRPDQNRNGFILGEYPVYTIQTGDHFISEVGCAQGSNGCDVSFQVEMFGQTGSTSLGVWNEIYDGTTQVIDIDLTKYAGQSIRFVLRMIANGNPALANGVWFVPSIRNQPIPATATQPPPAEFPTATPTVTIAP